MRKPYEKPFIARQQGGISNKFGGMSQSKIQKDIEGVSIASLTTQYGSPLFVYSERVIREKYQEMMRSFSHCYPKVQHAWSYKTNYLQAICKSFHKLGSWAEVVSAMEYEMARKLGIAFSIGYSRNFSIACATPFSWYGREMKSAASLTHWGELPMATPMAAFSIAGMSRVLSPRAITWSNP